MACFWFMSFLKTSTLVFLFLLPFHSSFAEETENQNNGISCSLTQSNGRHYSATCQDFSEKETKKIIDCCTLQSSGEDLITWGSNCIESSKIEAKQILLIDAKEPTATYCSVKFQLQEDFEIKHRTYIFLDEHAPFKIIATDAKQDRYLEAGISLGKNG